MSNSVGGSTWTKRRCAGCAIRSHRSHIGQIEAALRLLGKRLEVRVLEAT